MKLPAHIPALDGIRGVAVVGVVIHHLGHLRGGYLGVDTFFVLSGFLITGLLIDEAQRNDGRPGIALGRFWVRRAKRLFPALLLVLATVVAVERWVLSTGLARNDLRNESLSALGYVFNWQAIAAETDYWSSFTAPSPLRHMWSLAIEEQFYVVWPLLVAGLCLVVSPRRIGAAVGWLAAALALISVVVAQLLYSPTDSLRVYYGTDTRVAAILFGAVAAVAVRRAPELPTRVQRVVGAIGLLLLLPIGWAWIALDGTSEVLYRGGLVGVGLATAATMVAGVVAPGSLLTRLLSWGPLRWCGAISYGLYLWHWPVIVWLTPARTGLDGAALLAARLVVSVAATLVSYYAIEQPIRRTNPSGWKSVAWAVPALAAVGLLTAGATAGATDSPEQPEAGTRSTTPIPPPPVTTAVMTTDPTDTNASPGAADEAASDAPPSLSRLMVVGDSGAFFLGQRLTSVTSAESSGRDDVVVLERGEVGCGLINVGGGVRTDDGTFLPDAAGCADWPTRWEADIAAFQPSDVLIVYSWPGIGDREIDGTFLHPCEAAFDAEYSDRMRTAVDVASGTGARVVVATNPYYVGAGAGGTFNERVDCLNEAMTTATRDSGATVLDVHAWVCPGSACRIDVDGAELRPDGLHFDGPGGDIAAAWVLDELSVHQE